MKDPVSGLTHLAGAILAVVVLIILVRRAIDEGSARHVAAFAVFGGSLILLYTASSLYHLLRLSDRGTRVLRRLDHMMIYVLIAGTYTPICVIALRGAWGWSLLAGVWGLTAVGIVLKMVWLNAPRWLSTSIYLFMGWLIVVAVWPLIHSVQIGGLAWLGLGGLFYTIGALIYAVKKPNILPGVFGFHELFHLFVMAGSFSHVWLMAKYMLYIG